MPYTAPLDDFRLLSGLQGSDDAHDILTGAARLCETTLAPLQRVGDTHPARLENGVTRTPPGFAEGYRAIADGGWIGICASPDHGGLGLPLSVATAVNEMMASACLALQLNPLMTQGQIEALEHHASPEMQALYLPKLISGEWSGTMNLTEPQAGSDVGALTTRAVPEGETFRITGQKIYITWADNDFTDNVCHLVLARLPDAPAGTKGISLFMVPKTLPDGSRNALRVLSLEHKLGLHGSPTAVMEYDGATGWIVGAPHKGMAAMFTMMNNARLGVATQGIGVAEAACQLAEAHAAQRQQNGPIANHPDVRRMLARMRAETFAARAIALSCAAASDAGDTARAAFLTPIAKSFGTETGMRVADLGIQVHGGMGYIEETGAAQLWRDVRVTAIYEGTNGIQAIDLIGRKLSDDGAAAFALLDDLHPDLADAAQTLRAVTQVLLARPVQDRLAGATPYLRAFALVLGTHWHLRAAESDPARAPLARFMQRNVLPEHAALASEALEDVPSA
ncbi:acyl-CoA dehydrogenase [Cereibacter sp. SYSU M97828]|nr:acyl-CoA dehydrogenase [Cereibacter flavus]